MDSELINNLNKISTFLAKRDIPELSSRALVETFGLSAVEMIIVLGNSIPYIVELGAEAYCHGLGEKFMIAGGIGHSTKYLIKNVQKRKDWSNIDVLDTSEADILKQILIRKGDLRDEDIILEDRSTNCGANAREALKVCKELGKVPDSIILLQDPTMQLRTHASFEKEWKEEDTVIISYSPFVPYVHSFEDQPCFLNEDVPDLWSSDRFIELVMGEIPRLRDDESGYGPKGKGFISHVDVPQDILDSYGKLIAPFSGHGTIKDRK